MRIAVHAPFGTISEETGLIFLLVKHLKRVFSEIALLRCSGMFSLCDRDADAQWKRGIRSCFSCMNEQKELGEWAEVPVVDLSSYLTPGDFEGTKKWISFVRSRELFEALYEEINALPLVKGSFKNRFGLEEPNLGNRHHEQVLRRHMLSAVRTCLATKRFIHQVKPELFLIAGGEDFISASVMNQAKKYGVPVAKFKWEINTHMIELTHPTSGEVFSCGLVLDGLSSMRAEVRSWPPEISKIIDEIVAFLGIDDNQVPLPMAKIS